MHASASDWTRALALLTPASRRGPESRQHTPDVWGEALHRSETPYLALIGAVRSPAHLEHAVAALRLMLGAAVPPTLRTRVALLRMASRAQHQRNSAGSERARTARPAAEGGAQGGAHTVDGPAPPTYLPGAHRFWSHLPTELQPTLSALDAVGREAGEDDGTGGVALAADLLLGARMGALLGRINVLAADSGACSTGTLASLVIEEAAAERRAAGNAPKAEPKTG